LIYRLGLFQLRHQIVAVFFRSGFAQESQLGTDRRKVRRIDECIYDRPGSILVGAIHEAHQFFFALGRCDRLFGEIRAFE